MSFFEKHLLVKKSLIPKAGMGLFTKTDIPKGTRIVEYKGKKCFWRDVKSQDQTNGYLMRIDRTHAIDAGSSLKTFGRYANDARGRSRRDGLVNNAEYVAEGKCCYIEAIRKIPAGSEILVSYGADYWKIFG